MLDEFRAGRLERRAFLRMAAVLGFGLPLAGLAPRCARAVTAPTRAITVGIPVPAGRIEPAFIADTGGSCMTSQTGEYLAVSDPALMLKPALADSWKPNADGSEWTFKIRQDVHFHDGRLLTARDVAATINRLADPANGSLALSAFAGTLSTGGAHAVDASTVVFQLDAPNGSFPYLVSSDNYNAIILPADYAGNFEHDFNGTGPFRLEKYTPKVGASFVRNEHYWGPTAPLARSVFKFYDSIQAQVLAMQGGELDLLLHVPVQGSQALLATSQFEVISLKSSAHNQLHMRTDAGAFVDKRVRRAVALCLNRRNLVQGMFRGRATLGNDSPFAPLFSATDPDVEQRDMNIAAARQLLAQAGVAQGFKATLTTERFQEIPDFAVVIQNAVRKIGIDLALNVEDQSSYYGRATFGQSDWLDSAMGITDYGHRSVPNTFLTATLGSRGNFNAARFKNAEFDRLTAAYIAALDPAAQREAAGKIQRLLLDETPVIAAYFYDWLSVTNRQVSGIRASAIGQLYLGSAHFV